MALGLGDIMKIIEVRSCAECPYSIGPFQTPFAHGEQMGKWRCDHPQVNVDTLHSFIYLRSQLALHKGEFFLDYCPLKDSDA